MKEELRITKMEVVTVDFGRPSKRLIGRNWEKHELQSGKPNSRLRAESNKHKREYNLIMKRRQSVRTMF
jgi:hypothetical protein